jgi:hypothetical protein
MTLENEKKVSVIGPFGATGAAGCTGPMWPNQAVGLTGATGATGPSQRTCPECKIKYWGLHPFGDGGCKHGVVERVHDT